MTTGTVKFFNADKGYGFIQPEDGGDDAFVHITAVHAAGMQTYCPVSPEAALPALYDAVRAASARTLAALSTFRGHSLTSRFLGK